MTFLEIPYESKDTITIPEHYCVYKIIFTECNGELSINLIGATNCAIAEGFFENAWYMVSSNNLPTRYFRATNGKKSLLSMVKHYGFLDESMCLNTRSTVLLCRPVEEVCVKIKEIGLTQVPIRGRNHDDMGVPQRLKNSGNCWFSSVCFSLFFNKNVKKCLLEKFPDHLKELANNCLRSPESAEQLRKSLWNEYAFGDPIDQDPELDGQNGTSQIFILASQLDIPMKRYMVTPDSNVEITTPVRDMKGVERNIRAMPNEGEDHFIVLRFRRGQHSTNNLHQPTPIIYRNSKKYKLTSMMIGSEHCGHQIASASPGNSTKEWAMSDSDGRRLGIGCMHWKIDIPKTLQKEEAINEWWKTWRSTIPTIQFSGGVCDLSPHNRPYDEVSKMNYKNINIKSTTNKEINDSTAGLTNIDLIYFNKA